MFKQRIIIIYASIVKGILKTVYILNVIFPFSVNMHENVIAKKISVHGHDLMS